MNKQDRLNLDLRGLREKIGSYQDTPEWRELPWAGRVRILIEAGIQADLDEQKSESVRRFITSLSLKRQPSDDDIKTAAEYLNLPEEVLLALRDDQLGSQENGIAASDD